MWSILSSSKLWSDLSSYPTYLGVWISHFRIDLASVSFLILSSALLSLVCCTPSIMTCIYFLKHTKLFSTSGLLHMLFLLPESLFPLFSHVFSSEGLHSPLIVWDFHWLHNLPRYHSIILYHYSLLLSSQYLTFIIISWCICLLLLYCYVYMFVHLS